MIFLNTVSISCPWEIVAMEINKINKIGFFIAHLILKMIHRWRFCDRTLKVLTPLAALSAQVLRV
jgi:hypothetical protein